MAFKSEAQRAKFKQLLREKKISKATYKEWESKTGKEVLPKRVNNNQGSKRDFRAEILGSFSNVKKSK